MLIEYSKQFIDKINAYHHNYTCSGIHFYDSMIFLEKADTTILMPTARRWPGK